MIILPWYVRFALDCTLSLTPVVYFHYHPSIFFEYFQNRRRIVRRKSFEEFKNLSTEPTIQIQQVQALYKNLGIEI